MRNQIADQLNLIEHSHNCKILYACESGSRAWGFASPDSDFDLRFIYVHQLDWYLSVKAKADTIEEMAPNDLDLSGWELRKMLRLFQGCNLALYEWFDSPEVYYEERHFASSVRELIPAYFNPRKGLHHYLSMAEKIMKENLSGDSIKIKKAFYILRPLLACTWIMERKSMPPTRFAALRDQKIPADLQSEIDALLERKKDAVESEPITLSPPVSQWIHGTLAKVKANAGVVEPRPNRDWAPLEEIMKEFVLR